MSDQTPTAPSKAATAAAEELYPLLNENCQNQVDKQEAQTDNEYIRCDQEDAAMVIDKHFAALHAELAAAQKLLKEQRALYVRVDEEYDRKDKLLDEALFDNEEQARLLGAGASREAALMAQLSQAKAELANTKAALAERTEQANDHEHECIRLRAELKAAGGNT